MKSFTGICLGVSIGFFVLAGSSALYGSEDLIDAQSQLDEKTDGSSASDRSFAETQPQDDAIDSDPSAFEGDSSSLPEQRAPENLAMSDSPVGEGIAVE